MIENLEINIAHLYPNLLNIFGDIGNINVLKSRLEWRNIKVNVDNILLNNDIDFAKYDIYYIGGGCQDNEQLMVANELQKYKCNFKSLADDGIVIFGVSAGYQLLCKYYQNKNGNKIDGLGIFDGYTVLGSERLTGNVTVETDFLTPNTLVGFENQNGLTFLEKDVKNLGKVIVGNGNNKNDKTEGARYNNVFGTYLHGPILPKNPAFCDYLLECAIKRKLNDNKFKLAELNDEIENLTHKQLLKKAY